MTLGASKNDKRRFQLLRVERDNGPDGWFIWDRLRYRMADGVYMVKDLAQEVADSFERDPEGGDRDWYVEERAAYARRTWDEWLRDHDFV